MIVEADLTLDRQPGGFFYAKDFSRPILNRGTPANGSHSPACLHQEQIQPAAPTSLANFYLRDTLRLIPDPPLPGGPVAMLANCSPSGAMKRSKDGPLGTSAVEVPVQSALTT